MDYLRIHVGAIPHVGMSPEATRKHLMHLLEQYDKLSLPWESTGTSNGTGMSSAESVEEYYNRMMKMHKDAKAAQEENK